MRFQCPNCMSVVAIEDSEMGQPAACGSCRKVVVVPNSRTAPGAIIGDFLIEREVGQGGLGTVYLTHQLSLDRPAALKVLHERYAQDPSFVIDFVREARAAAQLNHPNIVQAYAVGEDEGIHFFAMEYANGSTLKQVLAHSGRLVLEQAMRIIHQIAMALNFAWENKQLVHRDIKPDNIILTDDGTVKLADLGLARVQEDLLNDDAPEILGTPQYVAPEQLLGKHADNRSDIYSLGATLYHTITGHYPYTGKTPTEIARRHIADPLVSPKSVVPDIKDDVSALIWVMMAKRPGHRYQSVADLIGDIVRVQQGKPISRKALKVFQEPIDLGRVEEELSAVLPSSAGDTGSKKNLNLASRRMGALRSGSAGTGKSGLAGKGKRRAEEKSGADEGEGGESAGTGRSTDGKARKSVMLNRRRSQGKAKPPEASPPSPEYIEAPDAGDEAAADKDTSVEDEAQSGPDGARRTLKVHGTSRARGSVRRRSPTGEIKDDGKVSSSRNILYGVLAVAGGLLLAMGLAVYLLAGREREFDEAGLTPEERAVVTRYERSAENDAPGDVLFGLLAEIETREKNQQALAQELEKLVGSLAEQQARQARRELRRAELAEWRETSRTLLAEQRELRARLAREAREAAEEARRREEEDRQRRAREERLARLREERETLREEALRLCRNQEYYNARIKLSAMAASPETEYKEWAQSKIETIKQAERAWELVQGSGSLLDDTRISVPGQIRPAYITSVDSRLIHAEIRDYGSGPDGEIVVTSREPVSILIEDLSSERLVDLMKTAWRLKDGRPEELDLLVGAYLLCCGENLDVAEQRLMAAGNDSVTGPMLDELREIREIVQ